MGSSTGTFTYWSLLGLSPGSNTDQLKSAFRREAMRWHPDLNRGDKGAEERFKWINEAYKVLSDPSKRMKWEIAGRPSIEIKDLPNQAPEISSDLPPYKSDPLAATFTSGEQLLLALISILSLFFLNAFIL